MAGNNIYMQPGSNYIDIHDNENVYLNVDKASLCAQEGQSPSDDDLRTKASILTENKSFMRILHKAVEQGFCTQLDWQYLWKVKVEAAYFASVASQTFNLSNRKDHDGEIAFAWKPFEALFNLKDLRLAYNDIQQCKTKVKRKADIDKLFK